jgi:hydroxyacylglutathione hydrolase
MQQSSIRRNATWIAISILRKPKECVSRMSSTHVHADHISGGRTLADRTAAAYALHESAPVDFPFLRLHEGQQISLGNVTAKVLHTPGHTPESICLLVTDTTRGTEPWFLLTGDPLFVGSVGRPDLSERVEESAKDLHWNLRQQILPLPDSLEVYPAHFSGSVCGKGMSGKPMSTLGFEKRFNPLLSTVSEEQFLETMKQTILPEPAHKAEMIKRNQGRCELVNITKSD